MNPWFVEAFQKFLGRATGDTKGCIEGIGISRVQGTQEEVPRDLSRTVEATEKSARNLGDLREAVDLEDNRIPLLAKKVQQAAEIGKSFSFGT